MARVKVEMAAKKQMAAPDKKELKAIMGPEETEDRAETAPMVQRAEVEAFMTNISNLPPL